LQQTNQIASLTFKKIDLNLILTLYCSSVEPILEWAVPAWHPSKVDTDLLERVQNRATKFLLKTRNLLYDERQHRLRLQNLSDKRKRSDLTQIFKCARGLNNTKLNNASVTAALELTASSVGGHYSRYRAEKCRTKAR
jgi:hypothetical protein